MKADEPQPLPVKSPPNDAQSKELLDPDLFTLAALILSTVSTATGLYAATQTKSAKKQRRERQGQLLAAIHRWEANLHDLRETFLDVRTFVQEHELRDHGPAGSPVLTPLEVPLELMPEALRQYKKMMADIYKKAKDLNTDAFALIEKLDDDVAKSHLGNSIGTIRESLKELQEMRSVRASVEVALRTLEQLLRVAEAIRLDLQERT